MRTDPISIVVACDDHYCIMLAALLKSIELNHQQPEYIEVYLVDDHISQVNKNRLQTLLNPAVMSIHYIPMNEAIPADMTLPVVPNSYPLNTYIRLLIPHFLPPGLTKVLFMDVDMIVLGDISDLWHTHLQDCVIGAVQDSITRTIGNVGGGGIANHGALGLQSESPYFNAGLQLIDVTMWKARGLTRAIMECIRDNAKHAHLGDQYGLNVILESQWHPLDPLWNYMANGDHPAPKLIHFIHRKPFYKSYFNNPAYQKIFYEYLSLTPWCNARPVGEPKRYLKKMNNIVQKVKQLL